MAPWFVFADIVNGSTHLLVANANLIKKTQFQSQILPIVRIISSMVTHAVFLIVLLSIIALHLQPFGIYYLQFGYYIFCLLMLALGISWTVSALNAFIRDTAQIVAVVIQVGFWATPILWDISIMPVKIQPIFKLNPMLYIVQGYRESFIYFIPFWQHPYQTAYFWVVTLSMLVIGSYIFRKLKPQFAEVL
jgi:lipopolysaccharide transport system permease protein/teichoic acid transport system permease protein